jgi:hypothetical protein
MFELLTEILKSLSTYPIIEAAGAILILTVFGPLIIRRGERDNRRIMEEGAIVTERGGAPYYLLISPVSDAFGAIHDIAEQSRTANALAQRIIELHQGHANELRKQTEAHEKIKDNLRTITQLLEEIRNNQEMRGDPQPPPNPRRHKVGI